jgi:hypothetical protein
VDLAEEERLGERRDLGIRRWLLLGGGRLHRGPEPILSG